MEPLLQWDDLNIPLKAGDGQATPSLPGNTKIIGQQWEKPTSHIHVSAETESCSEFLIEPLTLLPFVYIPIHHKKLNYLCSLTCIVINVLIMLLPSNLSPRNSGDVCLNNAASPPGSEGWIKESMCNNTPSPGSHLTKRGSLSWFCLYGGDLCPLAEHVLLLHTVFVRHAFGSRKLTNQLSPTTGADVSEETDERKKKKKEKNSSPPLQKNKANYLWPALLILLVKGYRYDSFRGMK